MANDNQNSRAGKRVFIHIGAAKTGSSAIQAFLSHNAVRLAQLGISYPFPESEQVQSSGVCSGNLMHVMQQYASRDRFDGNLVAVIDRYLKPAAEAAIAQSPQDTVVLSGEFIGQCLNSDHSAWLLDISRYYKLTLIAFVRDVYDYSVSSWKQRVKTNLCRDHFEQDIERRMTNDHGIWRKLPPLLDAGFDVRLRNYDMHKHDLIETLLQEIGVDSAVAGLRERAAGEHNPSISYWQAKAIVMAHETIGSPLLNALLVNRFHAQPERRRGPYSQELDERLLQAFADEIATINLHLPSGEALRTKVRHAAGPVDPGFSEDNMKQFMGVVQECLASQEVRAPALNLPGLPADFDPALYLLLNSDVAAAGMDAAYHYLNHGRYEGRAYTVTT